jgi:hypothetical protein
MATRDTLTGSLLCQVVGCRELAPWSYEYECDELVLEVFLCRHHEHDLSAPRPAIRESEEVTA